MTEQHKNLGPNEIHPPFSFFFEGAEERLSAVVTPADRWKFAVQTDDESIWFLVNTSPIVWVNVLLFGSKTLPTGPAGGALSGNYPNPTVLPNSHSHTPGVSIPAYPTSLPPSGPAGGGLIGNYPNPNLPIISSLTPGVYTRATITVDKEGRVINAVSNEDGEGGGSGTISLNNTALTGNPTAPTPPYGNTSTRLATTEFVGQAVERESLPSGSTLTIDAGYQKVIKRKFTLNGTLRINGRFFIEEEVGPNMLDLNYVPLNRPLTIPAGQHKIVVSSFRLESNTYIQGILRVI